MINIKKKERKDMVKKIDNMTGFEFEDYLYYVFLNMGYKVERTPYSVDYGADLIITKDNVKTVVQAKRYNSLIGVGAIQEVLGAKGYYNANETLVVTNNSFTTNAKILAKKNKVKLWERSMFLHNIILEDDLNLLKRKAEKRGKKKRKTFNENIDIILEAISRS